MAKDKKKSKKVKKAAKATKPAKTKKASAEITKPRKERKIPAPASEITTIQVPLLKVPAPEVEEAIEPVVEAPAPGVEAEVVDDVVEAKPVKVKKTMTVSDFHFDPPITKWERKPVDTGWRSYRLWTSYELDWDDKDDDEGKMKSIRSCMAKSKSALVKDLAIVPETSLVVKTDLKKDEYPFEPFVEVWMLREKEGETLAKLVELPVISTMDAEFDGDVVEPKEPKPAKKAKSIDKIEEATV
jgi:hypothetical protein